MNLASFSPEVHEEEMSNPVSSADIASSIRERELEEEILRLKKDLDLAKRDRRKRRSR
jgi:tellurite resistance protein